MVRGKTVLATGAFDLLHLGHVRFLEEAKRKGGPGARLVVVVASDRTVTQRKGRKPILPDVQRRKLVSSLRTVDQAVLGYAKVDMLAILNKIKPDIICVGYDQQEIKKSVEKLLRREGLDIRVVQIRKFGPDGLNSSSQLKGKVAEKWKANS